MCLLILFTKYMGAVAEDISNKINKIDLKVRVNKEHFKTELKEMRIATKCMFLLFNY